MNYFLQSNVAQYRYDICQNCEQLNDLKICKICTCFMPFKTRLPWVVCPLGLWKKSDEINLDDPFPSSDPNTESDKKEQIIIVP